MIIFALLYLRITNTILIAIVTTLSACLLYQIIKIVPYTRLYTKQMLDHDPDENIERIGLMISNVLMKNKNINGLVEIIDSCDPDLLLVVEVDFEWHKKLSESISFENVVSRPLDNTYGMILYSKFAITEFAVENLVEKDVPSIHAKIELASGKEVFLHCLHPKPPAPQESTDTTERDAELLIVGKMVKQHGGATLVAGDLNDVAWSYTTILFQKISHLLDPRVGRGMFNSFHAMVPFLRFPLDHAFASKHFKLVNMKRLARFGSDHFPLYIELALTETAPDQHDVPFANKNDKREANEKIEEAIN